MAKSESKLRALRLRLPSILLALGLAACSRETLVLTPPTLPDQGTLILFIDDQVFVSDLSVQPGNVSVDGDLDRNDFTLTAATLPCPPSAYGLAGGLQELTPVQWPGPASDTISGVSVSIITDGTQGPWAEAEVEQDLIDAVAQLPREPNADCRFYFPTRTVEQFILPESTSDSVSFAVDLDDSSVLLGTRAGRLFEFSDNEIVERTATASIGPVIGAVRDGNEVWLFGHDTRLIHGSLHFGFTEVSSPDAPNSPDVLDLRRAWLSWANDGELFAITDRQSRYRYDGTTYVRLGPPGLDVSPSNLVTGGLVAFGAGRHVAALPMHWVDNLVGTMPFDMASFPELIEHSPSGPRTISANGTPTSLTRHPIHGFSAGLPRGGLLLGALEDLVPYGGSLGGLVLTSLPEGAGVILAGESGLFLQFHEKSGFCDAATYGSGDTGYLVRTGTQIVVVGGRRFPSNERAAINVLTEAEPARGAECAIPEE